MILEDQFGDIIQKARSGLGKSKKELTETAGIQIDRLDQIEACLAIPREDEVLRLASLLGLDKAKLLDSAFERWSPNPPPDSLTEKVIPITGDVGGYMVNGYIIYDKISKDAAMIDTANHTGRMLDAIKVRSLKLRYIFLTHSHRDHIGDLARFEKDIDADIYIGEEELKAGSRGRWKGLEGAETFSLGSILIHPVFAPGHTNGSISYLAPASPAGGNDICFVGDTIFAGSVGRSTPASLYPTLLRSLRERILSLDDRCLLAPGHGPITSVGEEKKHNPFF